MIRKFLFYLIIFTNFQFELIYANANGLKNPISTATAELNSFDINQQNKSLSIIFSTDSEVNTSKFEIEKSMISDTNKTDFVKIAEIKATGTTNNHHDYGPIVDNDVDFDHVYEYRLKIIDKDQSVLIVKNTIHIQPNQAKTFSIYASRKIYGNDYDLTINNDMHLTNISKYKISLKMKFEVIENAKNSFTRQSIGISWGKKSEGGVKFDSVSNKFEPSNLLNLIPNETSDSNTFVGSMHPNTIIGNSTVRYTIWNNDDISDSISFLVTYLTNSINGVLELYGKNSFQIYPNPCSGYINFKSNLNIYSINLVNEFGEKIQEFNYIKNLKYIDIGNISNGIYFLEINSKEGLFSQKILVMK